MDISFLSRHPRGDLRQVEPTAPALSLEDTATWSYRTLDECANRCANALLELGLGHGDRVAIVMHNSLQYWALYLGTVRIGAIAVRLNFRLASEELEYALLDSGAEVLCTDTQDGLLARLEPIRDRVPVQWYFCLASEGPTDGHSAMPEWVLPWERLAAGAPDEPAVARPTPEDPAMLMYTSGTTGRPKGALWTHGNTTWFAGMQAMRWQFGPNTVAMTTGPLYHVGGLEDVAIAALAVGGHVVTLRSGGFDIRTVLRLIAHHWVTDVLLFPFMIYEMMSLPDIDTFDLSSLQRVISGGDPVLPHAIDWMLTRYPIEFVQIYGLTEGTPVISCSQGDQARSHPGSVGEPMPFAEISIRDDNGAALPSGEAGEIWTRSPVVCREYWNRSEATAATFVDGWCRTGDTGYVNNAGLLVVSGRTKDMIRSGGENIYPAELEDVLLRHPAVADVAVIGVPDPRYLETVCAVIVPETETDVDEQTIIDYSRHHLASYKKPRFIVFTDALPRTPSGKVTKYVLREHYHNLAVPPQTG